MVGVFGHPQGYAGSTQHPGPGMGSGEPAPVRRSPTRGSPFHTTLPRGLPVPIWAGLHPADVTPRIRAKVALDQVRQRHQKTLRELAPEDIKRITRWITPPVLLGESTVVSRDLHWILPRTGNTAQDRLQYWMLREMDDGGLDIVCKIVDCFMRGERLEALAHRDLHLFPPWYWGQ